MRYLVLLCLLLASWHPAQAQRLVARQVALGTGQAVALELKYAHHIRVRPGNDKALAIKAQVAIADPQLNQTYDLAVTSSSSEVLVEEKLDKELLARRWKHNWPDGHHSDDDRDDKVLRIDYEITLPAATSLTLSTISGDIEAENLVGAVTLKSISGDLKLAGLSGAVQARAISGDIHLTNLPGRAPVDAESISGDVDANWPSDRAAELLLKSLSGEVYADSSVKFNNLKAKHYVGYTLRGHTGEGEGGPLVSLSSISGNVFFRQH